MVSIMISMYVITIVMAYALCRVAKVDERCRDSE